MDKKRFRLSHTFLNLWAQGLVQEAINCYFHINPSSDPKMAEGRRLHEKWAREINEEKSLKLGRSAFQFRQPLTEYGERGELILPYNELWDLNGRFDCLDEDILYEFKSGVQTSLDYADGYQIPFYFLLAELAHLTISKAYLIHYNQYLNETDFVIIHNSEALRKKARNFIDSLGWECFDFFQKAGLIKS